MATATGAVAVVALAVSHAGASGAATPDPSSRQPSARAASPHPGPPPRRPPGPAPGPRQLPEFAEGTPATLAAARVMRALDQVRRRLRDNRYQHRTFVGFARGIFHWDCSGMVGWVLRHVAPGAFEGLWWERPVASSFVDTIEGVPATGAPRGWGRVAHIRDVRPGDVFAWRRDPTRPWQRASRITGHVGFVVALPQRVPWMENTWAIRIADATSIPHQDDTRDPAGDGGFGLGTMLFTTDGAGRATGYGWRGIHSQRIVETPVVFGRVVH